MITQVRDLDADGLSREAEMYLLRHLGDSVSRMADAQERANERMSELHSDIAVIKARDAEITKLIQDVRALELRNAQQDGAFSLATVLKDFGPWILGLGAALWALFFKKP